MTHLPTHRHSICAPVPELGDAARYLDAAVSAHLQGHTTIADELIRMADMPAIREWSESIWGANSPHLYLREVSSVPAILPESERIDVRMPNAEERRKLHDRDGYRCRFCGIPVIRKEVRVRMRKAYPSALQWGRRNTEQHSAFQAMWLQYDHLLPHARGGTNELDNIIITCGPCNFGKWNYTIEELGLSDPRDRPPIQSTWDGLERFR